MQHEQCPSFGDRRSSSPVLLAARGAGWPKASTILSAGLPPCLSVSSNGTSLADTLAATELDLLARYLIHTSHIIPVDDVDVHALQVGIPNLAFRSSPLMDSVLALAAVCRCHEILNMSNTSRRDWQQLEDLLALANHRYESSLHQIQDVSCDATQYDSVLANATMMVLYGSASHSLRIRLAESSFVQERLLEEFPPAPLQWTSLIRAAHLAYTGLQRSDWQETGVDSSDKAEMDSPTTTHTEPTSIDVAPEYGPSVRTRCLTQPIIAATSSMALQQLADRLQVASSIQVDYFGIDVNTSALRCCSKAFAVLCDIFNIVTLTSKGLSVIDEPKFTNLPQQSRLSGVSPWLRTYVARVTSAVPQRQLRRIIMSFLNRVPMEFLRMIQESMDDSPIRIENTAVSQLLLDIFAHWLVLVTLLDGVWWIGGIGEWELERAVRRFRELEFGLESESEWWPERMLDIRRELFDETKT